MPPSRRGQKEIGLHTKTLQASVGMPAGTSKMLCPCPAAATYHARQHFTLANQLEHLLALAGTLAVWLAGHSVACMRLLACLVRGTLAAVGAFWLRWRSQLDCTLYGLWLRRLSSRGQVQGGVPSLRLASILISSWRGRWRQRWQQDGSLSGHAKPVPAATLTSARLPALPDKSFSLPTRHLDFGRALKLWQCCLPTCLHAAASSVCRRARGGAAGTPARTLGYRNRSTAGSSTSAERLAAESAAAAPLTEVLGQVHIANGAIALKLGTHFVGPACGDACQGKGGSEGTEGAGK